MLSYQHIYHAGNLADVHKHALLCWMLDYMAAKPKPLSYGETHAGRGLYFLDAPEAVKTGEAAAGIEMAENWFGSDHPYARALASVRRVHGVSAYPGSPMLAEALLRPDDRLHLAELHPGEHAALSECLGRRARIYRQDGFEMAQALLPPEPRRGVLLVDPSYEIKSDYDRIPGILAKLNRKWNVGVIVLWYPILTGNVHHAMLRALEAQGLPGAMRHEVRFPPVRDGHRMIGSGLFVVNAPYCMPDEAQRLSILFGKL